MAVLVSDTSILIDLERAALLEIVFSLSHELVVPDYLYHHELEDYGGEQLIKLGLRVEGLNAFGVEQAAMLRSQFGYLSIADSFALVLAETLGCGLLTGDKNLRKCAEDRKVICHGLLWVFDEIEAEEICALDVLHHGLVAVTENPKCRLPKREVSIRLDRYKA